MRDLIKDTPPLVKESRKRKQKIAQHPTGFKPTTSKLCGVCSTAVLQLQPYHPGSYNKLKNFG